MNLRQLYLKQNDCYKACKLITPQGILVHSTGVNNPNLRRYINPDDGLLGENTNNNHWNQSRPDDKQICLHAFIGKLANGKIATYQTLPFDIQGWFGSDSINNTHICFAICESSSDDTEYFELVYKEAVEFCVHLCKMFKLNPMKNGVLISQNEACQRGLGNSSDLFQIHAKSMDTLREDVNILLHKK